MISEYKNVNPQICEIVYLLELYFSCLASINNVVKRFSCHINFYQSYCSWLSREGTITLLENDITNQLDLSVRCVFLSLLVM
jgi:hypothetical protein